MVVVASILAILVAALLVWFTSKQTQRRVISTTGILMVGILVKDGWEQSIYWRVQNYPALTTTQEREFVTALNEMKAITARIENSYSDIAGSEIPRR